MIFKIITFQPLPIQKSKGKFRRNETLLTVDFNLRDATAHSPQVPQGRHSHLSKVPSLQDLRARRDVCTRRLKPAVNKVLSLAGHFPGDAILLQLTSHS